MYVPFTLEALDDEIKEICKQEGIKGGSRLKAFQGFAHQVVLFRAGLLEEPEINYPLEDSGRIVGNITARIVGYSNADHGFATRMTDKILGEKRGGKVVAVKKR